MAKLSVKQTLAKAKSHIKKGEVTKAQTLYTTILQAFPNNKEAQQGLTALGRGRRHIAEQEPLQAVIDKLINLYKKGKVKVVFKETKNLTVKFPKSIAAWNMLGISAVQLGKLDQAVQAFEKMISLNPNDASSYYNLGNALKDQGKLEEAIQCYNNALAIKPDYEEALNNVVVALKTKGKSGEQRLIKIIETYNKAQSLKTENAVAQFRIAAELQKQGKLEDAIKVYHKALAMKPDYADAYSNIGVALVDQGKPEEAIEAFRKTLAIKPDHAEAYLNIGYALKHQGQLEEAIKSYNKALAIKPDYADAYNNIGVALADQGKPEEAIEACKKALAIKPNDAEAFLNMGNALKDQGQLKEAIRAYNNALAIKPDYAEAHHNASYAYLALKDFEQGFEKQEWRWKTKKFKRLYLKTQKPPWSGETSKRILIWAEQGIGDEIMFSSIIPELYAISSKIIVKCDKRLIPLFKRSFPREITYYSRDAHVSEDDYDFHIPMGSLPLNFRKSSDSFKNSASGFLNCDTARAESIKGQLALEPDKKLVGISWNTKSSNKNSSARSINLSDLARAVDDSNTKFVCLQYGDVSDEIEAVKRDFGIDVTQFSEVDNNNDIDGLASLIWACDQIVSTTNVTVHLAGALGVKITVLLPFAPRWIWGDGSESFFYENVTLIKQNYHDNWNNVLDTLRSNNYS